MAADGWNFTAYVDPVNNGNNQVYSGNPNEDKHGTHIAGIIGAGINNYGIEGVAPNVKILPVKCFIVDTGTVANVIRGIQYAEMMGAAIVNCSWGSHNYSQALYDAMNMSNMLFVCAAGNTGIDTAQTPYYPATYDLDNIVSVAAIDNTGDLADFSNYGSNISIAAPGKQIYSTVPNYSHAYMDGTSRAAPFAAGLPHY